jgi:hypothetical protein
MTCVWHAIYSVYIHYIIYTSSGRSVPVCIYNMYSMLTGEQWTVKSVGIWPGELYRRRFPKSGRVIRPVSFVFVLFSALSRVLSSTRGRSTKSPSRAGLKNIPTLCTYFTFLYMHITDTYRRIIYYIRYRTYYYTHTRVLK